MFRQQVSKGDLRLLRNIPGETRVSLLMDLYSRGMDIGKAVAEAYKEGVEVSKVVARLFSDGAINFMVGYDHGWDAYCLVAPGCYIKLRASDLRDDRAAAILEHYIWAESGEL